MNTYTSKIYAGLAIMWIVIAVMNGLNGSSISLIVLNVVCAGLWGVGSVMFYRTEKRINQPSEDVDFESKLYDPEVSRRSRRAIEEDVDDFPEFK